MANKWIIAAATAALFCSADWLAGTRTLPVSMMPVLTTPAATAVEPAPVAAHTADRVARDAITRDA